MSSAQPHAARPASIPSTICARDGCGGIVLRHSLGCGQAVYRCHRCFTTYDAVPATASEPSLRDRVASSWSRFRHWREDD